MGALVNSCYRIEGSEPTDAGVAMDGEGNITDRKELLKMTLIK